MENANILAGDLEQGVNHVVGEVVDGVAHGNRAGESAQGYIFIFPISNDILIDLPKNWRVIAIDTVELLVSLGAQVRIGGVHQRHQFASGQFLHFAIHFDFEHVAVGN